jgi:ribonuclease HII
MRQQALLDPTPIDTGRFENPLYERGVVHIAGVDEAGRGCLAGPVVAAAVILPRGLDIPGLDDSKKLTEKERDRLFGEISQLAVATAVGVVSHDEIDRINILQASLCAMRVAVDGLSVVPEHLLIDGHIPIGHAIPETAIKKGDVLSRLVAAASVIAKVTRDRMMAEMEGRYPQFKFSVHKGYGTALHMEELRRHGPTPIHRMTFRGVPQAVRR